MKVREALTTFRGHREPRLRLMEHKKWWFALSGFFVVLSLVGLLVRGLNFSIAFRGGAQIEFANASHSSTGAYQSILARYLPSQDAANSQVEVLGGNKISIQTVSLSGLGNTGQEIRAALARQAGISINALNETDVGPTWGSTISTKALQGLVIFLILVTLYISFRFEWKVSVSALSALLHDLIITAGVYALVGRQVTPESVIAILTILGYSLYDDVVIFDKVKENADSPALVARETYEGVVNMSLNQTLMRSVNTSLVVLLPIGSLLLFGGQTLKDFAFALFVGIASGTYSSIFVASPILAILKEREPRYQQIRARALARAPRAGLRAVPALSADAPEDESNGEAARDERQLERAQVATRGRSGGGGGSGGGGSGRAAGGGGRSTSRKKKKSSQGKPKRRRR